MAWVTAIIEGIAAYFLAAAALGSFATGAGASVASALGMAAGASFAAMIKDAIKAGDLAKYVLSADMYRP